LLFFNLCFCFFLSLGLCLLNLLWCELTQIFRLLNLFSCRLLFLQFHSFFRLWVRNKRWSTNSISTCCWSYLFSSSFILRYFLGCWGS
jgi:hypothetical protein